MFPFKGRSILLNKVVLFCCLVGATGCSPVNSYLGWPDDHPLEEITEFIIKNQLGEDVDLSPASKE